MRIFGLSSHHVPRLRPEYGGFVGGRRIAGGAEHQLAAVAAAAEYGQIEALVSGIEGDAVGKVGNSRSQVHFVLVVDRAVIILVVIDGAAVLFIDAEVFPTVIAPHRLALVESDDTVQNTGSLQFLHFAVDRRKVRIDSVREFAGLILPAELEFETVVVHLTHILSHARFPSKAGESG